MQHIAAADFVVITEGEKAADAATEIFRSVGGIGICWIGGCKTAHKTQIAAAVSGKSVRLWPDNDDDGRKVMSAIERSIRKSGGVSDFGYILTEKDAIKGHDAADFLTDGLTLADVKMSRKIAAKSPNTTAPAEAPPTEADEPALEEYRLPRFLGTGNGQLYLWNSNDARLEIVAKTESAVKNKLLVIAEYEYWCSSFPKPNGFIRDEAVNYVITSCLAAGAFNPQIVRGIGVFKDADRHLMNTGSKIILSDNSERSIRNQGRDLHYLYSRGGASTAALNLSAKTENLSDAEAAELADLIAHLGWGESEHAVYLLGWLVASVISGALAWRPHIWITGAAGSGKSWVLDNIIKPCFDEFAIYATGNTSEAALRNLANDDSRPILYDEAEVKTTGERQNIVNILALARASSTEHGASVSKSLSGGGGVIEYRIRSCFMFSSITSGLNTSADAGRFLNLSLRQRALTQEQFKAVARRAAALTHRTRFGARFIIRAFNLAKHINAAVGPFADVVERHCGDKRLADTTGAVLAAAYIFETGKKSAPSDKEISDWLHGKAFSSDSFKRKNYDSDDVDILTILATKSVKWDNKDTTISEAIMGYIGHCRGEHGSIEYKTFLRRMGIKVEIIPLSRNKAPASLVPENFSVFIAKNPNISKLFYNTPYESAWFETLKQNILVEAGVKTKRVGIGVGTRRYVEMPAMILVGRSEPAEITENNDEMLKDF